MKTKKTSAKTTTGRKPVANAKTASLLATTVVATNKAQDVRPDSFFGVMAAAASKPIELSKLITTTTAKAKLRSKKDKAEVVHTRVRDAFTRLGLLKKAGGAL
jgi:hypothetical protein